MERLPVSSVDEDGFTEGIRIASAQKFLVKLESFVDITGGRPQQRHQVGKTEMRQLLHVRINEDLERPVL